MLLRLAAAAVLAVLASCSGGSQSQPPATSTGPDAEKVLNVYNWFDYIDRSVISQFEREYGIHVNYDVFDAEEILDTRLLSGHTGYDVVVPSTPFFEHQVAAGAFRPLDRQQLPNLTQVDPEVMLFMTNFDPGNRFGVVYTWLNTTGIAFDAAQVHARLPTAPVDSLRMVFDVNVVSHFQDCGVAFIDSAADAVEMALIYLGRNPNSESLEDLAAAEGVLMPVRRYLRYIDTGRYISDLANGDICVALGWSGDVLQARDRAREAGKGIDLKFAIPREGSMNGADVLAIPIDAPHPGNAHLFVNYLLRPDIAARITNVVGFANGVAASLPLVRRELRDDPVVYPSPQIRAQLYPERARSSRYTRRLMRMWTRFKTAM